MTSNSTTWPTGDDIIKLGEIIYGDYPGDKMVEYIQNLLAQDHQRIQQEARIKTVSEIAKIAGERAGADPEYSLDAFAEDIADYASRIAVPTKAIEAVLGTELALCEPQCSQGNVTRKESR
jgi:hypothetical protein